MSINISNFNIDLQEILDCSASVEFSLEVTDDEYAIDLSNTYFIYNNIEVTTHTVSISNGYRAYCTATPDSAIILSFITYNTNNDNLVKEYKFDFGYNIGWNAVKYWDNDTEIPLQVNIANNVTEPNNSFKSTFFHTKVYNKCDLLVDITAEGSGSRDVKAYIKPQSKKFKYGNTYSVTVSGIKDFSGNTLNTETFTFRIEENNT